MPQGDKHTTVETRFIASEKRKWVEIILDAMNRVSTAVRLIGLFVKNMYLLCKKIDYAKETRLSEEYLH